MISKRIKLSLFYQYLFSYILLLFIPLIIVCSIVYYNYVNHFKEQVALGNNQLINQVMETIDTSYKDMTNITVNISAKPELSPYRLTNFYDIYNAQNVMDYQEGNDVIYDLFLYIRGHEYIYSSRSSYSLPMFHQLFEYRNWDYNHLTNDLNSIQNPKLRIAEDITLFGIMEKKFVTLMMPIPLQSRHPYGTVLFLIEEDSIRNKLQSIVNYSNSNVFILDAEGRMVTSLAESSGITISDLNEYVARIENSEPTKAMFNEETFYVSHATSEVTEWSYITLVPEKQLMGPLNEIRNKALWSVGFTLIIGICLIYLCMHIHYSPLKDLIRTTEQKWGQVNKNIDGIEKVHLAINHIDSVSSKLRIEVQKNKYVIRQHLLTKILKGQFNGLEELSKEATHAGMNLSSSHYLVMVVHVNQEKNNKLDRQKMTLKWLEHLPNHIDSHFVDMFENNQFTYILSNSSGFNVDWEKLHQSFISQHSVTVTIGVGNHYEDILKMNKSYIEATTALQYKWIKGTNKVICIDETKEGLTSINWYPSQELENLELAIKQADQEKVMRTVNLLLNIIKQKSSSLFMAKYLCVDVMNTVMKVMNQIDRLFLKSGKEVPDVLLLAQFDNIEELEQLLKDVCRIVCQEIEDKPPIENSDLLTEILDYINKSYEDYDFSLQSLSDHFSLSIPYLGKYFKEQTCQTIMEYVNHKRIERAKELLKTTDMQIKEIVFLVGHSDVSSFIRKFKKYVDMTPGQYRKLHH